MSVSGYGPPREPDSAAVKGAEAVLVNLCGILSRIQSQSVGPEGGNLSQEPSAGAMGGGEGGTIRPEVPPGAVSSTKSGELRYALLSDGPFTLPEGYQLGSMVVYLYYNVRPLTKPLTLSLPHWYGGEDHDQDGLSFAMAPHTLKEGEHVYRFELLESGRFRKQLQYGVLEFDEHSFQNGLFAIVFRRGAVSRPPIMATTTPQADTGEAPMTHCWVHGKHLELRGDLGYGGSSTVTTSTHSPSHLVERYQKISMHPLAEGPSQSQTELSSEEVEEESKHQESKVPSGPAGEGSGPPREPDSVAVKSTEAVLVDLCWIPFGIQSQSVGPEGGKLSLEPSAGAIEGGEGGTILLEVPPGAISPPESVKARSALIPNGSFTLPEGFQLGSMVVYLYYDGHRLTKPCTLSLPHWYGGEDQVRDGLSFVMAPHTLKEGESVYHFELLEGGRFAEQQRCGVLQISGHCTLFAVVFKVKASSLYYASLWTHQVGGAVIVNNEMHSKVVITYAYQVWIEVLKNYWKDWKRHPSDQPVQFKFSGNKVQGMLSVQHGEGWEASLKGTGTVRSKLVAYHGIYSHKALKSAVKEHIYPPAIQCVVMYQSPPDCSRGVKMNKLSIEGAKTGQIDFPFKVYEVKTPHPPTSPSASSTSSMGGHTSLLSPVDTGGEDISHTVDSGRDPVLYQKVYDRQDHLKLFRKYVSRKAATKGRAVLEGVGLLTETINACFSSYPRNEEEAVQAGLTKWSGGQGRQPPTWEVLISAMEYANIAQQHVEDLKKELCLRERTRALGGQH